VFLKIFCKKKQRATFARAGMGKAALNGKKTKSAGDP
jgi:hypothetical protein